MKNKILFYYLLIAFLIIACGEVDKSYNSNDKVKGLLCFGIHNSVTASKEEKDMIFTGCLLWVKNSHDKRVKRDGGLNCWNCHKSL